MHDCLHIEDVHLLFCAHFTTFFSFWGVLNLDSFSSKMLRGGLVCAICNSKSFHSFLFKLCIMIVHILKMCTFYFVYILRLFFSFLRGVELRYFSVQNAYRVPGLCNL